jgi:hypothetical protein
MSYLDQIKKTKKGLVDPLIAKMDESKAKAFLSGVSNTVDKFNPDNLDLDDKLRALEIAGDTKHGEISLDNAKDSVELVKKTFKNSGGGVLKYINRIDLRKLDFDDISKLIDLANQYSEGKLSTKDAANIALKLSQKLKRTDNDNTNSYLQKISNNVDLSKLDYDDISKLSALGDNYREGNINYNDAAKTALALAKKIKKSNYEDLNKKGGAYIGRIQKEFRYKLNENYNKLITGGNSKKALKAFNNSGTEYGNKLVDKYLAKLENHAIKGGHPPNVVRNLLTKYGGVLPEKLNGLIKKANKKISDDNKKLNMSFDVRDYTGGLEPHVTALSSYQTNTGRAYTADVSAKKASEELATAENILDQNERIIASLTPVRSKVSRQSRTGTFKDTYGPTKSDILRNRSRSPKRKTIDLSVSDADVAAAADVPSVDAAVSESGEEQKRTIYADNGQRIEELANTSIDIDATARAARSAQDAANQAQAIAETMPSAQTIQAAKVSSEAAVVAAQAEQRAIENPADAKRAARSAQDAAKEAIGAVENAAEDAATEAAGIASQAADEAHDVAVAIPLGTPESANAIEAAVEASEAADKAVEAAKEAITATPEEAPAAAAEAIDAAKVAQAAATDATQIISETKKPRLSKDTGVRHLLDNMSVADTPVSSDLRALIIDNDDNESVKSEDEIYMEESAEKRLGITPGESPLFNHRRKFSRESDDDDNKSVMSEDEKYMDESAEKRLGITPGESPLFKHKRGRSSSTSKSKKLNKIKDAVADASEAADIAVLAAHKAATATSAEAPARAVEAAEAADLAAQAAMQVVQAQTETYSPEELQVKQKQEQEEAQFALDRARLLDMHTEVEPNDINDKLEQLQKQLNNLRNTKSTDTDNDNYKINFRPIINVITSTNDEQKKNNSGPAKASDSTGPTEVTDKKNNETVEMIEVGENKQDLLKLNQSELETSQEYLNKLNSVIKILNRRKSSIIYPGIKISTSYTSPPKSDINIPDIPNNEIKGPKGDKGDKGDRGYKDDRDDRYGISDHNNSNNRSFLCNNTTGRGMFCNRNQDGGGWFNFMKKNPSTDNNQSNSSDQDDSSINPNKLFVKKNELIINNQKSLLKRIYNNMKSLDKKHPDYEFRLADLNTKYDNVNNQIIYLEKLKDNPNDPINIKLLNTELKLDTIKQKIKKAEQYLIKNSPATYNQLTKESNYNGEQLNKNIYGKMNLIQKAGFYNKIEESDLQDILNESKNIMNSYQKLTT